MFKCSSPVYIIFFTFEKIMGKLTKIFPIQGWLMDFQDSEEDLKRGIQTPIGAMNNPLIYCVTRSLLSLLINTYTNS